jgi:hypothetical protein
MIIISIYFLSQNPKRGRRGRDRMVVGNTTTYAIVPITTEVVISNLDQGDVYFNNISVISWRSVLLMEETGGPRENHRPVASH